MLQAIPVTHVAGVGSAKQRALQELGIETVHDLLHYFPVRYEDFRVRPFESFVDGAHVTARGVVDGRADVRWQGKRCMVRVRMRVDGRHPITAVWFNQPYVKSKLVDGRVLTLSGRYNARYRTLTVSRSDLSGTKAAAFASAFTPVYRASKNLPSSQIQSLVHKAMDQYLDEVDELLPHELMQKYRLISHRQAVAAMHAPDGEETLRQAHRRLAFEEFFLFQLQLQWFRRARLEGRRGVPRAVPEDALARFQKSLPSPLTPGQLQACRDVLTDLRKDLPMHRLLEGDVGSGKTWVALWAAYCGFLSQAQAVLMAPTEILAEQHAMEARRRLEPLGMRVELLTGSTSERDRRALLPAVAAGDVHLLVGTHALLTEKVQFANLGIVVIDEQHRFGVAQRAALQEKGRDADVLYLSATPIPRTLALAVYGDMDMTRLQGRPAGRKPVRTVWLRTADRDKAVRSIRRELETGRQAYVVAPLVEDDSDTDAASATALAEEFAELFAGYQVGLLHGRLTAKEKERVMRAFLAREIHILVSTTVIEVGIDVPNATVMLIYHAERFGLAQLHQLRGRVGRGEAPSMCILLSDATSELAQERLQTMTQTDDGFEIAERDLQLRGPGEFLGVRQSGLPEFSVGDLTKDLRIMDVARQEATALMDTTDFWLLPKYERLRREVQQQQNFRTG
ncbi:ATP-dependent DNA helicase RecG [Alicyclobacillus shizuokensis]|uniref:ATP-dependent DNA helicase RecG n=1 Tax=Alicyclobacillus shizuokensis TaxID=392014 RepID=UPI0008312574|nr:ATP-dependent DNA helicase RecG [Alicyclobacillus shizuokensis]